MINSRKISIADIELTITNQDQILNMGGPGIGDVAIDNDLISKDCILDNFVYNEDLHLLFFVKYNRVSKYQWYFSINFYNVEAKTLYEFDKVFDMVYLGKFISKNELEIFHAFHGEFANTKSIFNLDEEEFEQIN
jgi:hypothetical protein